MMQAIRCTLGFLGSAAVLWAMLADAGDQRAEVGFVQNLNAPLDRYRLERDDQSAQLGPGTPLQENDVLWIKCTRHEGDANKEEIQITIQLANGAKVITCKQSPYRLTGTMPWGVTGQNPGDRTEDFVSSLTQMHKKRYLAILALRGGTTPSESGTPLPMLMPLIGRHGGRLAAGKRDLHLAWNGGGSPYSLQLRIPNGATPVAARHGLQEAKVNLTGLDLRPGSYELVVTDARGQVLIRRFEAVPSDSLPASPQATFVNQGDQRLRCLHETAYAYWLSAKDRGLWMLEAYQHVAGIASEFYPAELVRLKLEGEL